MFLGPNVPHAYLSGDCVEVWDTSCQKQILIENKNFEISTIKLVKLLLTLCRKKF